MSRISVCTAFMVVAFLSAGCLVHAEGEDTLALTGEYTFFLKQVPGCTPTFYQKMVPCVEKICEPVPRRVVHTYPVPVPVRQKIPTLVCETPLGCAQGEGPCLRCMPPCTKRVEIKECVVPQITPVQFNDVAFDRRTIRRPTMRPQWFQVSESPMPCHPRPTKVKAYRSADGG